MTITIWDIIADTPWWVYVLIIFFIRIAYLATKPQLVSIKKMFALPLSMLVISTILLATQFPIHWLDVSIFVLALLLGSLLGWLHFRIKKVKAIMNQAILYVPGSWNIFILLIAIIVIRFNWNNSLSKETFMQPNGILVISLLLGSSMGLMLGRLYYSLKCLKSGPFLEHTH